MTLKQRKVLLLQNSQSRIEQHFDKKCENGVWAIWERCTLLKSVLTSVKRVSLFWCAYEYTPFVIAAKVNGNTLRVACVANFTTSLF